MLKKFNVEAYRLYDRDIPEYPFIVDIYKNTAVIYDRREEIDLSRPERAGYMTALAEAVEKTISLSKDQVIIKERKKQKGLSQYERVSHKDDYFTIKEGPALLRVNVQDFLDTGLFLDHRIMRQKIFDQAKDKRILNLFCYTGSVSVFGALGGGRVTSVDMSNTYVEWAKKNFEINHLPISKHEFIVQDALEFLEDHEMGPFFDLIFLDPPTFSNSKKMEADFEVERDQKFLVTKCLNLLAPNGVLYFSNNKRTFKIDPEIEKMAIAKNITEKTIPFDFHDKKIHHVFEIRPRLIAG